MALLEVQGVPPLHDEAVPGVPVMKPLLVGEDNPYGTDPRYALYPMPLYSAGGRLCHEILQLSTKEYIKTFDRVNLCSEKWSLKEARGKAFDLLVTRGVGQHDHFVLFGSKVCKAFNQEFKPFESVIFPTGPAREVLLTILPHPSGRNRIWNEPGSIEKAREMLHRLMAATGG